MRQTDNKAIAIVDMGTTNTRLSLLDGKGTVLAMARGGFGVKDRAATGDRTVLIQGLHDLTGQVLEQSGLDRDAITVMLSSGMITSEVGLKEIPHLIAPVGLQDLAENAVETRMPEIGPMPIVFVPGIRNRVTEEGFAALPQMDFMRGEETQVFGAMDLFGLEPPATMMFLSSHTKLVDVDEHRRITGSFTTLSGQVFSFLRHQSLLASSLPAEDPDRLPSEALDQGVRAGLDYGLQRSGLLVRFMDTLQKTTPEERLAFLEGIILASDLRAIAHGHLKLRGRVYMLGNRLRAEAYERYLGAHVSGQSEFRYLGADSMDEAARRGALVIAGLRSGAGRE